jgi:hypothetical protein
MINKEFGSDFHYVLSEEWRDINTANSYLNKKGFSFHFSGRSALYSILKTGIDEYEWKKIVVPSYYCHEVYHFIASLPITIEYYNITPLEETIISLKNGDDDGQTAVLIVDYFGISKLNYNHIKNASIIEDLTHNLAEIKNSKAHFCFGSLRKVLPLPVGGFCYSPKKLKLSSPDQNIIAESVAIEKFTGMYLKALYLKNQFNNKDIFRSLYTNSENDFELVSTNSQLPKIVFEYLKTLRIEKIILQKKENLRLAKKLLKPNKIFSVMNVNDDSEFALTLKFKETTKRDLLRIFLIEEKIYPIILWPNQWLKKNKEFEDSILFIHIDFRYNDFEIKYIVSKINQYIVNAHI